MTEKTEINPFRSRRVRIVEPGWESFNGHFGTVEFVNGLSVQPVAWQEQQRLAGLVRMDTAEDDEEGQLGPAIELTRGRDLSTDDARVQGANRGVLINGQTRLAIETYDRDELERIADAKGIVGLRDIAKAWDVTGRSISELITKILDAQAKAAGPEPLPGSDDAGADG